MTNPVIVAARAAARRLEAETGPGLVTDVEVALATRESPTAPPQYVDPLTLAGLIVSIASFAWTVYTDLKKRTAKPAAEVVARHVRVALRDAGETAPSDHIVNVVVTETILAADQEHAEEG